MKIYEKPKLMVLSISANDALCTGCSIRTRGDAQWSIFDPSGDGLLTKDEANSVGLFGSNEDDLGSACSAVVDGYCKFNGTDPALVFTS